MAGTDEMLKLKSDEIIFASLGEGLLFWSLLGQSKT